jgi:cytochrome P450
MTTNTYPPGPASGFFGLKAAGDFLRDPLAFLTDAAQYGDIVYNKFGNYDVYLLNHPDYIRQMLVTDAKKFQKWERIVRVFSKAADGLFVLEGDTWKQHRKLVQPAFHTKRIANYADIIRKSTLAAVDAWGDGTVVDMESEMTTLTMRIIAQVLFSIDIRDSQHIAEHLHVIAEMLTLETTHIFAAPDWLPTPRNLRENKALREVGEFLMGIIRERRTSGEDNGDLLSALLFTKDEDGAGLDDEAVLGEVMTLFFAGHETTASGLTWLWYLLTQYPDAQDKLYNEVTTVLKGRAPTLDDLDVLDYARMCFKESMRVYPPAWITHRETLEAVEIGGYTLKPGAVAYIAPWAMHHDARYWDEPMTFKPERFTKENEKHIGYEYIPFGGGPRVCVGNHFALMEAVIIIATVMANVTLTLEPGQDVIPNPLFILRPKNGLKMRVHRRTSPSAYRRLSDVLGEDTV